MRRCGCYTSAAKEFIISDIMKTYSRFQKIIVWVLLISLLLSLIIPIMTYVVYADEVGTVVDFADNANEDNGTEERKYSSFKAVKDGAEPHEDDEPEDEEENYVDYEEPQTGVAYPDPNTSMGKIYKYITEEMGLNRAVAFGILSHMRRESRYIPTAYNPAGYYGICQWGGNRYTNLISWCNENGYDYTTIDGQVRFMDHELNGPYSKVLAALLECENTADGAYDAAYVFGMRYEVSGLDNARNAGYSAMEMFNRE